jgi:hypothetical protein
LMAAPLGLLADKIGPVNTFAGEGGVILVAMLVVVVTRRAYTFDRDEPTTFAERQADADDGR